MSERTSWIWLSEQKGIGWRTTEKLLERFGSAAAIYAATEERLRQTEGITPRETELLLHKNTEAVKRIEEQCLEKEIRILCFSDADYPVLLKNIPNPPMTLYVKGRLPNVDTCLSVGIVGTRRVGEYGRRMASKLGNELASVGVTVVTGMAEGVDSAAASGALEAHGPVIGVLGNGVDVVYPKWNRKLQESVSEFGALVSEYPPGFKPTKWSFPKRNRIISGLSRGIAVVQASAKSGSLITAEYAQEQGRDVFVIPGLAGDAGFAGSHALIRDGAQLINGAEDILESYRFSCQNGQTATVGFAPLEKDAQKPLDIEEKADYSLREQLEALSETELVLVRLLSEGDKSSDLLIRESEIQSGEALAALMLLQIKGYICEKNGQYHLEVN